MELLFAFLKVVAVQIVLAALQPFKVQHAKRYDLSEFQVPTATEDRCWPLPFGTFSIAGNVLWYGDYYAQKKTKKVRSLFSSKRQTVGHRYHIGQWISLSVALCDSITEVRFGDRVVWSGALTLSKTGATTLAVSKEWTTSEGQQVPDGFSAHLEFIQHKRPVGGGTYTPIVSSYLESQLGAGSVPAYPDKLHVVVHGPSSGAMEKSGFVGSGPHIPSFRISGKRMPDLSAAFHNFRHITYPVAGRLDSSNVRNALNALLDSTQDVHGDANPAYVILEMLTTRTAGVGPKIISEAFDVESFLRTGERLHLEGNGASWTWESPRPVGEVVEDLLRQINGVPHLNLRTGQLGLLLMREDDVPVHAFDASNVLSVDSVRRVATEETVNATHVPFIDRLMNWAERTVIVTNPAGVRASGATILRTAEFIGVSREVLARQLAAREQRASATPLAGFRWTATVPYGTIFQPGELVTLDTPEVPGGMKRVRILTARYGDFDNRGRVELEGVEDLFRTADGGVVTVTQPPVITYPSPPTALVSPLLTPAPYALTGSDYDRLLYLADDPGTETDTFQAVLQDNRTSWSTSVAAEYIDGEQEPCISPTLVAALPSSNTTTFALNLTSAQAEQWKKEPRAALFMIAGSEWMQCASWSLNTTTNVLTASNVVRGIFDTVPARQAAGAAVRILLGFSIDEAPLKTRLGTGGLLDGLASAVARAECRGAGGTLDPNNTAASQAVWSFADSPTSCRAFKPLPPANLQLGASVGVLSADETAPPVVRSTNVSLYWKRRSRTARTVTGYYSSASQIGESDHQFGYAFAAETSPGVWQSYPAYTFVDASSLAVDVPTAPFPAGQRRMRGRFISRRTMPDGSVVDSAAVECFWTLSA